MSRGKYDFEYRCGTQEPPRSVPQSGSLRTAIRSAKKTGCSITLYDKPGFKRGWVKPDGNYRLT